jgi:hypothetical protein
MGTAVSGLKIIHSGNKADDTATLGNIAKLTEAVTVDIDNIDKRVKMVESKGAFTDLGAITDSVDVSGKPDGIYIYTEGGTKKAAIISKGQLIPIG